jgi:hypothetical protein
LPACCSQPAVAGGVIYADLWGEVSTHLALQALFTQSSSVCEPLLQAFPFPSTLGKVTLHLLSQACMFIYSSHGKWVFPPSCGVFLPLLLLQTFLLLIAGCMLLLLPAGMFVYSSCGSWVFPAVLWNFPLSTTLTSFPAPGCWARAPAPAISSQARLVYLQFREGFPSPTSVLSAPHPLCYMSLLFLLLITQFLFFPWVEVSLSRGLC